MSPELEKKLFEKYPKIFPQGRDVDPRENLMFFGFECGDGWYQLLDYLCGAIQEQIDYVKRYSDKGMTRTAQVVAAQVKEKFGTLRFYYDGGGWVFEDGTFDSNNDQIDGMIAMAEHMSARTCDVCGEEGTLNEKGWIACRCPKHKGSRET